MIPSISNYVIFISHHVIPSISNYVILLSHHAIPSISNYVIFIPHHVIPSISNYIIFISHHVIPSISNYVILLSHHAIPSISNYFIFISHHVIPSISNYVILLFHHVIPCLDVRNAWACSVAWFEVFVRNDPWSEGGSTGLTGDIWRRDLVQRETNTLNNWGLNFEQANIVKQKSCMDAFYILCWLPDDITNSLVISDWRWTG